MSRRTSPPGGTGRGSSTLMNRSAVSARDTPSVRAVAPSTTSKRSAAPVARPNTASSLETPRPRGGGPHPVENPESGAPRGEQLVAGILARRSLRRDRRLRRDPRQGDRREEQRQPRRQAHLKMSTPIFTTLPHP